MAAVVPHRLRGRYFGFRNSATSPQSPMKEDLTMSVYDFAQKYRSSGAFVQKVKIGNNRVSKCFLKSCPKCGKKLPGTIAADWSENCTQSGYNYRRQIVTLAELGF
jgi:hypothetical protein